MSLTWSSRSVIIQGQGRLTSYEAPESGNTVDFQAGDVGYVPVPNAHYLENTGDEDLIYVGKSHRRSRRHYSLGRRLNTNGAGNTEILQAPVYNDISVAQWLGLTPKQVVKDHLGFSEETLDRLPQVKNWIVPGSTNATHVDFGGKPE